MTPFIKAVNSLENWKISYSDNNEQTGDATEG
jgi:hypothetical protein